jgi:primase-polymerase (primpol)-like protein
MNDGGAKVPCGPRVYGKIDCTDPANWSDYETAARAVGSVYYHGVGFVLGGGVVGIDLDDCRDPASGALTAKEQGIVDRIASYTEVSPSGTGVKIFLLASTGVNRRTAGVEIYSRDRYFTVTGQHVPGTPDDLQERTEELAALCKELFGTAALTPGYTGSCIGPPRAYNPGDDDDNALLRRAHDAANGGKFADLFAGRWQGRYPSQSEADLALCQFLAFWTDRNPERMDRLFRRSGLMRAKWDEGRGPSTYGANTIRKALD